MARGINIAEVLTTVLVSMGILYYEVAKKRESKLLAETEVLLDRK